MNFGSHGDQRHVVTNSMTLACGRIVEAVRHTRIDNEVRRTWSKQANDPFVFSGSAKDNHGSL